MPSGLVVLIAENDSDMRGYVRRCLELHGLPIGDILEARDGLEALTLAGARSIDLLISDGAMPRLDGFELCSALRRSGDGHRTAVLLITGQYDAAEASARASAVGADGLLLKPFNATTLCGKIDEVLESRSANDGTAIDSADEQ